MRTSSKHLDRTPPGWVTRPCARSTQTTLPATATFLCSLPTSPSRSTLRRSDSNHASYQLRAVVDLVRRRHAGGCQHHPRSGTGTRRSTQTRGRRPTARCCRRSPHGLGRSTVAQRVPIEVRTRLGCAITPDRNRALDAGRPIRYRPDPPRAITLSIGEPTPTARRLRASCDGNVRGDSRPTGGC